MDSHHLFCSLLHLIGDCPCFPPITRQGLDKNRLAEISVGGYKSHLFLSVRVRPTHPRHPERT